MNDQELQEYLKQQKKQIYRQFIDLLLNCTEGEEAQILESSKETIDAGLIVMMEQIIEKKENSNDSTRLKVIYQSLNTYLKQNSKYQKYLDEFSFIDAIFQLIVNKVFDREISNVLELNVERINFDLILALRKWLSTKSFQFKQQKQTAGYLINKLGMLIHDFPFGNKKTNIELAIAFYAQALYFYTKEDFLQDWISVNSNLGTAYVQRIAGNKKDNVELAIQYYTVILNTCKKIDMSGKNLTETNVGRVHINLSERLGLVESSLANAYSERIFGTKRNNIEIAIKQYKSALKTITKTKFPRHWALILNNLSIAHTMRIEGDRRENIELSIKYLKSSLKIRTKENYPQEWANAQNSLGSAYQHRVAGNKRENIELAIKAHKAALQVFTKADFSWQYAMTINNLAVLYKNRIQGDWIDNLETAITLLIDASMICNKNDFPTYWADIKNHLGLVYYKRILGNRAENIELAIIAFKHALEIYTKNDFPDKWAMINNNLANTYRERIYGDRSKNSELAILANLSALEVYTKEDFPLDWAMSQHNLGLSYRDRIEGNKSENFELAIAALNKTLEVWTEKDTPYHWAFTQHNLGYIYEKRIKGDRTINIKLSIKYYQATLDVCIIQSDTLEFIRTSRSLVSLYFAKGDWQSVIKYGTKTIEAIEKTRFDSFKDRNKEKIISSAVDVYQNIVQAYINLEQIDRAIEHVERVKARNLVDLLVTRDLRPKGDISRQIIDRLDSLRQEVIVEERRFNQKRNTRNGFGSDIDNDEAKNRDRLNQILQELDNLIQKQIQPIDPSFQLTQKVEPISYKEIQATLPNSQTAIIKWFIGNETLSVFIIIALQATPIHISYTAEQFQALVDNVNKYYDSYRQRDRQWQNNISILLAQIGQSLKLNCIINQIKQIIPDCDRLILVPHRWLHLLPINALPLSDGKCLLDLFTQGVSYAPSVQLLELTQKQSKPR